MPLRSQLPMSGSPWAAEPTWQSRRRTPPCSKSRATDVAHLAALSRATLANIHQNVVFALALKGLFLVTSVLGITGLWIAVLADTGATARIVTLNAPALRFKGAKSTDDERDDGTSSRPLIPAESY